MSVNKNLKQPELFKEKLAEVMEGMYELFELAKEHDLERVSESGVVRYDEQSGKTCFQVSRQFTRPSEYLESLLDLIRANFEPCVLGTFFLNANMGFLYDAIPDKAYQLGYISISSAPGKPFPSFWHDDVVPYIKKCGYSLDEASHIFAVASTGEENYGVGFVDNICTTLNAGFSVEQALALISASRPVTSGQPDGEIHCGFCLDSSLGKKIRMSLWLFINPLERVLQ